MQSVGNDESREIPVTGEKMSLEMDINESEKGANEGERIVRKVVD